MINPTASPTVSSTIGLKNVVIAPLEVDTEETLTYGTLQSMVGAIFVLCVSSYARSADVHFLLCGLPQPKRLGATEK